METFPRKEGTLWHSQLTVPISISALTAQPKNFRGNLTFIVCVMDSLPCNIFQFKKGVCSKRLHAIHREGSWLQPHLAYQARNSAHSVWSFKESKCLGREKRGFVSKDEIIWRSNVSLAHISAQWKNHSKKNGLWKNLVGCYNKVKWLCLSLKMRSSFVI